MENSRKGVGTERKSHWSRKVGYPIHPLLATGQSPVPGNGISSAYYFSLVVTFILLCGDRADAILAEKFH